MTKYKNLCAGMYGADGRLLNSLSVEDMEWYEEWNYFQEEDTTLPEMFGLDPREVETVIVPFGTKRIGYTAFAGCSNLKKVYFPSSLEEVYHYAFAGCTSLQSVELPESVTQIATVAFGGCTNLTSVKMPGVKSIELSAFDGCEKLGHVECPAVESIHDVAFRDCKSLEDIKLNPRTKITEWSFYRSPVQSKVIYTVRPSKGTVKELR